MLASSSAFDVDGMLGGMAKWLRVLGFPAAYPRRAPGPGRFFVTTAKFKTFPLALIITGTTPLEQVKEALEQAHITPDPDLFLSRCLICDEPVVTANREQLADRVPEKIRISVESFRECRRCGRIYWEGGHHRRMMNRLRLAGIFKISEDVGADGKTGPSG